MGYLANFIVYTLAMVGVIVIALLVFKGSTVNVGKKSSKLLNVIDTMSLGPRKTLYIVSAGKEKFLIAGDVDKTCLISKLENSVEEGRIPAVMKMEVEDFSTKSFKETMDALPRHSSYIDRKNLGIKTVQEKPYNSVMKNLAERIRQ